MALGNGTRCAARRWLEHLPVADIPRLRALFTHHPDYADLTPVQYADGLAWLLREGLVTPDGRSAVQFGLPKQRDPSAAERVHTARWNPDAEAVRRATGLAGELAVIRLLEQSGSVRLDHVAAVSDAFGYDIEVESQGGHVGHVEVKSTTDPTRLRIHLTRHEYEVMCSDPDWLLAAVLVGTHGDALHVVTVSREWLIRASPADRDHRGGWESARFDVPGHVMASGIVRLDGRQLLADPPLKEVWGVSKAVRSLFP
ncbi:protein NO VEIN domain-containing protein [Streptomyces sp. NPDC059618]|uniref:protein NO VEIN domain-containing protein n=1 Tax=Streptomyces sp. NPDC059618 TaxID=3346887 RepID=UPI003681CA1D